MTLLAYGTQSVIDPVRTFASPEAVEHWSPTTLREKLIKIGAKVVLHSRDVTFQKAERAYEINKGPLQQFLYSFSLDDVKSMLIKVGFSEFTYENSTA